MRKAVFGEPIRAEHVENLPADGGPTSFVRLSGALIGQALAERFGHSVLPQITERVFVPDGAVDATYTSPLVEGTPEAYGLIGPGRTVFQFKYRDHRARGRASAVRSLRNQLRKDFARSTPACDRFVLMTNLDLAGAQVHTLRTELDRVPALAGKPIVIAGAAELAVRLNQSPHLRHLFFSGGVFCTLDYAEDELKAAYSTVGWPRFLGRLREIEAVAEFVGTQAGRLLQVIGPRYAGKTRLVIEALRAHGAAVLWCSRAEDVSLDHFRDLDSPGEGTILVIDGLEARLSRHILEAAEGRRHLKTVVISSGGFSDVGPGKLVVGPLEPDEAAKLVSQLLPRAPWREQSWVRETASGLPGLLLHVAALLTAARISSSSPSRDVSRRIGELLERYLVPLDPDMRAALSVAALLSVLGVEEEPGKETDAISAALGVSPEVFRSRLPQLETLGLVRRRGRFVEVVPPRLADHLAARALAKPEEILAQLRVGLSDDAFLRFLERFRYLPDGKARSAIERLFSPDGWFRDVNDLASAARHLEILAPEAPLAALECLERLLSPLQSTDLQSIAPGARRSIVSTLEDLALRSITFPGAVRLLFSIADSGNGIDATSDIIPLFYWRHPEVATPLAQRATILQEEARSAMVGRRVLVARACGAAFGCVPESLHHAGRGELPERPYRPDTADELRHYAQSVLDVLTSLVGDDDPSVTHAATDAFLVSFRPLVKCSLTPQGLSPLGHATLAVMDKLGRSAPNALSRQQVVSEIELLVESLSQMTEPARARTEALDCTSRLLENLTEADLLGRVWRWAGPSSWRLMTLRHEAPLVIDEAVHALASQLVRHPAEFEQHADWLTGAEAERSWDLFKALGGEDRGGRTFDSLLSRHRRPEWAHAFSAYIVGWAAADRPLVDRVLDGLAARSELASGVLRATASLSPSGTGIDRILRVLDTGAISLANAAREIIFPLAWHELAPGDFERLLCRLDDRTPDMQAQLIWPLRTRLTRGAVVTPAARDLGWAFLSTTAVPARGRRTPDWDSLASELGKSDPARLLALIETLITSDRTAWQSLSLAGELPLVWRTLTTADRQGLLRVLLNAAMVSASLPIGWQLEQTLNLAEDADVLLGFARERGVGAARMIALLLEADLPGFWEFARAFLAEWGDDDSVCNRLLSQVGSGGYAGSAVPMVAARLVAARPLVVDGDTRVATWARDAVALLEQWQERAERDDLEDWIWDHRIRRAELEQMVQSHDSSQRLWAIGRLLKDAPVQRVRDLLTAEEILDALPRLTDLDETTRRKWTGYARHLIER